MQPNNVSNPLANQLDPQDVTSDPYVMWDLELDDDTLIKTVSNQLNDDINHWEQTPWQLTLTDKENTAYLMGDQKDGRVPNPSTQTPYVDNRLFASVRAILSYATGQTAKPALTPSKTTANAKYIATQMEYGLYQHAVDHDVNTMMRLATKNLVTRKRGALKLRWDPDYGPFGDVCTDNVDPSDIVIDRYASFKDNPTRIYHRQRSSLEQLCYKFPEKKAEIYAYYGLKRGTYSQVSRMVTYWECWFTYYNDEGENEGVCWFIPNSTIVLGKMRNPNWIYTGSKKRQKIINMTSCPIKPFIWLNYWPTGRAYIDETCLFDQARPLQDILNKRGRQIVENADYANPRLVVNGSLWDESDATKFVNKNPKTIGILNKADAQTNINNAVMVVPPSQLPAYVMQDKNDARTEVDTMMGTPVQFRGDQPSSKNPTLGQDLLVKNQAAALQDDLVGVINQGWQLYYVYLIQMMNTYMPDEYWMMVKGSDGEYIHLTMNSDNIDTNVRLSVAIDSTLPLDKQSQRATAIQLAQINRIDDLSLYEFLGLPDPAKLVDRKLKWETDRITYMESVEQQMMSQEANSDITLLIANQKPEDRDDYNEDYLNHFNLFLTSNRFQQLSGDIQQRLTQFLSEVANKAAITEGLKSSMVNPAGMLDRPPTPSMPQRQIRIMGQLNPEQTAEVAGLPPTSPQQPANGGSPPAPTGQPSPPRMQNPSQFNV